MGLKEDIKKAVDEGKAKKHLADLAEIELKRLAKEAAEKEERDLLAEVELAAQAYMLTLPGLMGKAAERGEKTVRYNKSNNSASCPKKEQWTANKIGHLCALINLRVNDNCSDRWTDYNGEFPRDEVLYYMAIYLPEG